MAKLTSSLAVGDYDRTRPLIDGTVQIDGISPITMTLTPEKIFFLAFRDAAFDICELSLSSFAVKTAAGDCPYVGVPAFRAQARLPAAIDPGHGRHRRSSGAVDQRGVSWPGSFPTRDW
jgi:4,5-dihydroxyphthalate decarboxylase